jgi:ElaB/YqjD/DUF883 family membrane-anchored ribosome-binding protein
MAMESILDTSKVREVSDYANGKINTFLEDVEDLTKALKNTESPDIARVRTKVKIALTAAKSALNDSASQVRDRALSVGSTTDNFVRDNPWQVVGIAALVGLAVGVFASRRS